MTEKVSIDMDSMKATKAAIDITAWKIAHIK